MFARRLVANEDAALPDPFVPPFCVDVLGGDVTGVAGPLEFPLPVTQVGPLLPGTAGCLVLITSRRRLTALDGAQPLALDTLPADQAIELFLRLTHRMAALEEALPINLDPLPPEDAAAPSTRLAARPGPERR